MVILKITNKMKTMMKKNAKKIVQFFNINLLKIHMKS